MTPLDWLAAKPIAHRGLHDRAKGRVENTIGAVQAATERDFAVEVDLRLTGDEHVIVFHDERLDRLTEAKGLVERADLAAIRATRLHDTSDRIATLDELLEEVAGCASLFLELKSEWKGHRRLERQVAQSLAAYSGPVAVMSFDPGSMRAMRDLAPQVPRGLVADRFREEQWPEMPAHYRFALHHLLAASYVLPQFIAYDVAALPATAPLMIRHMFGLPLLTWTVRTPADIATARHWADQMIFEGFDPAIAPGA